MMMKQAKNTHIPVYTNAFKHYTGLVENLVALTGHSITDISTDKMLTLAVGFKRIFGIATYLYVTWILFICTPVFLYGCKNILPESQRLQSVCRQVAPFGINRPVSSATHSALPGQLWNILVLAFFAVVHYILLWPKARTIIIKCLRRMTLGIVNGTWYRSIYSLIAAAQLHVLYATWQSNNKVLYVTPWWVWRAMMVVGLVLFVACRLILLDSFSMHGLRQTLDMNQNSFRLLKGGEIVTTHFYKYVRHLEMTGLLLMIWATPTMTLGHFLFSVVTSTYILLSVKYSEEPRMKKTFGKKYEQYMTQVPAMYLPSFCCGSINNN